MTITTPTFTAGQRVIAPPREGTEDPAQRAGGPGVVLGVHMAGDSARLYIGVMVDGATTAPMLYEPGTLKPEPTI